MTAFCRRAADVGSAPYVAPFAVFVAILSLRKLVPIAPLLLEVMFLAVMLALIAAVARPALDLSMRAPAASALAGVVVFVLWIAPDLLFPGYRHHLENSITGTMQSTFPAAARLSVSLLALRTVRAVIIVPVVEELFWRAWLMRWIISPHFQKIPLGAYAPLSFWTVAVLFASEHGPYWDVGLAAGILYNWWMMRTRSLGDLIFAHAVTNACLSAYVIAAGKWEYWL
ncbi:MAG TPA: CAAX prenyl protease-related protein [Bryobacteraceae bacterium]|nr:CAAX prenyl protease-related protein [Bryobacteraceae bacterium]